MADMIASTEPASLDEVPGSEVGPGWGLADPLNRIAEPYRDRHTTCEALEQAVHRHIAQRTSGRLRGLQVEVDAHRVVVRGSSSTYYLKQLALVAVQEALPATRVELDIQVANCGPRPALGDDCRAVVPEGTQTPTVKFGLTAGGRSGFS